MPEFERSLRIENLDVVGFYPYTSRVIMPLLSQNHNYETHEHDFLEKFGVEVRAAAERLGCAWDNKVVVELRLKPNVLSWLTKSSSVFVGQYDGKWSVGFGVAQPDSYTSKYNQTYQL